MTASEMEKEFLILYDKVTNFDAPGYTQEEISYFLTKAQRREVLHIVNPLGNKYNDGIENTELRRKDLSDITKVSTSSPSASQVNVHTNGEFFDLPTDLWLVLKERATLDSSDACIDGTEVTVTPVTMDEFEINLNNPFKKPDSKHVWRLDIEGKHELITDGTYTVDAYKIWYIKKLQPIIIDGSTLEGVTGPLNSELSTEFHQRIVDEAVKIATGVTNPELYNIKMAETTQSE